MPRVAGGAMLTKNFLTLVRPTRSVQRRMAWECRRGNKGVAENGTKSLASADGVSPVFVAAS